MNTSTTPKVEYGYADGSDNHVRPTSLTYPDGRVLTYSYGIGDTTDSLCSRVMAIKEGSAALATYRYLGVGTVVEVESPLQSGFPAVRQMKFSLVGLSESEDPDTGDIYKGLDRFGRVKESLWLETDARRPTLKVPWGGRAGLHPGAGSIV